MTTSTIHFLIPWDADSSKLHTSSLASIRLRSAVALESLNGTKQQVSVGNSPPKKVDIVVIGKIGLDNFGERSISWLSSLNLAKKNGAKIFLDYTDHHLGFDSPMKSFYENALNLADICITPSGEMKAALAKYFPGKIHVIPDPIEVPLIEPKVTSEVRTVLWFGHSSNAEFLAKWLVELPAEKSFSLVVLSNPTGQEIISERMSAVKAKIRVSLQQWSIPRMVYVAKLADLCVIPSDADNPRKAFASSNRLLTALALGLPTAATQIPSYQEFSDYFADIEADPLLLDGQELARLTGLVKKAQREVLEDYSKKSIGYQWEQLLSFGHLKSEA